MFDLISKRHIIVVALMMNPLLSLHAAALTKLSDKHTSDSFASQSIRLSDQLVGFKEKSLKTWHDMPTWGKVLTVGTVSGGVLLLSMCAMNSKKNKKRSDAQQFTLFSSVDRQGDFLTEPFTISADDVMTLKNLLRDNPDSAEQFLKQHTSPKAKAQMLAEVMRNLIRNTYTKEEKPIVGAVIEYRELFSAYDWFELWQYACEHEAQENHAVIRDWLGKNLVTELYLQADDKNIVEFAVQSGVTDSAQIFQLEASEEGITSRFVGTLQEVRQSHRLSSDNVIE